MRAALLLALACACRHDFEVVPAAPGETSLFAHVRPFTTSATDPVVIPYEEIVRDPSGLYSAAQGFIAPTTADYLICASLNQGAGEIELRAVSRQRVRRLARDTRSASGCVVMRLEAGAPLSLQLATNTVTSVVQDDLNSWVTIDSLANDAVSFAGHKLPDTILAHAMPKTVRFEQVEHVYDASAYADGYLRLPRAGLYLVTGALEGDAPLELTTSLDAALLGRSPAVSHRVHGAGIVAGAAADGMLGLQVATPETAAVIAGTQFETYLTVDLLARDEWHLQARGVVDAGIGTAAPSLLSWSGASPAEALRFDGQYFTAPEDGTVVACVSLASTAGRMKLELWRGEEPVLGLAHGTTAGSCAAVQLAAGETLGVRSSAFDTSDAPNIPQDVDARFSIAKLH